jgi:hypothetical protein
VGLRVVAAYANIIQLISLISVTAITESATLTASKWVSRVVCCEKQQSKTTIKKSSMVNDDPECCDILHTDIELLEETRIDKKGGAKTVIRTQNHHNSKFVVDGGIKDEKFKANYEPLVL